MSTQSKKNTLDSETPPAIGSSSSDVEAMKASLDSLKEKSLIYIPYQLDELGLTPFEYRTYCHVARRANGKITGKCFASAQKISLVCGMSVRKAHDSLNFLCQVGLIIKESRPGRSSVFRLTSLEKWPSQEKIQEARPQAERKVATQVAPDVEDEE